MTTRRFAGRGTGVAAAMVLTVGVGTTVAASAATGPPKTATVTVSNTGFKPATAVVAPGGTVTWKITQGTHSIVNTSPIKLFNSGSKGAGSSFAVKFPGAGLFPYKSTAGPAMSGKVNVPVVVTPASGTRTTMFNVRWAAVDLPSGYNEQIDVKVPGRAWQSFVYLTPVHDATFTPSMWGNKTGTYQFRARYVKGSNRSVSSGFSLPTSITVR